MSYTKFLKFRNNPDKFFRNFLDFSATEKQLEVVKSVRDNKFTVVKSGHGVGKTAISASIILWFLFNHKNSIILTTAPTARQVAGVLWKEISRQYKPNLGGQMTYLRLRIKDGWEAIGFTARESVDHEKMATRFQGYHAKHMLIVFDEGAAVHPAFWTAAKACMTAEHSRFLAIGNPTSPSGVFYEAFKNPLFNKITISCYDHPNVIKNKQLIPGAVTREWIEERKKEWGENSPLFQARVLGQFPEEGDDTLISLRKTEAAIDRIIDQSKILPVKSIGVDVARFGTDKTVIILMEGQIVKNIHWHNGKDLNWTLGTIKELDEKFKSDVIVIDDTGVGGGVVDGLKYHKRKIDKVEPHILPVNFGSSPSREYPNIEFENIKAEIFWLLKQSFDDDMISIPDDGDLISQLSSIKYEYTSRQKIKIVSKQDMKKKGFKSPDDADALALAHWGTKKNKEENYDLELEEGVNLLQAQY